MERESRILKVSRSVQATIDMPELPSFEQLSEDFPEDLIPVLDRKKIDETHLTKEQKFWRDNGYLVLPSFIPNKLIDAYLDLRKRNNVGVQAWNTAVPYMFFDELKDICCYAPLSEMLKSLIGDEMGMHFNITHFHSTERGWHQDDCLNPPDTYSWYAAIWVACEDIHADSGPFEFVPGSHKWRVMKSDKIKNFLKPEYKNVWGLPEHKGLHWASLAEVFTTEVYEKELVRSGLKTEKFLAKKGDVLIWHGRLLHRGSVAKNENLERPAIITHYSRIATRRDIGDRIKRHKDGGYYWDFPNGKLSDCADIPNMERLVQNVAQLEDQIKTLEQNLTKVRTPEPLPSLKSQLRARLTSYYHRLK